MEIFSIISRVPRVSAVAWWTIALSAWAFALYATGYFFWSLEIAPDIILESVRARQSAFIVHAGGGALALLTGPFQFRAEIAFRRPALHRRLGMIYLVAAAVVGFSGIFLAIYSFGGLPAHFGFGLLGFALLVTTFFAYLRIRQRCILAHRAWMIRSYAVMLGAISFRLWLLVLGEGFSTPFVTAYQAASFLCWLGNLAAAEIYLAAYLPRVYARLRS